MLPIPKLVQPLASMMAAAAPAVYFSTDDRNSESASCRSLKGVHPTETPDQCICHEFVWSSNRIISHKLGFPMFTQNIRIDAIW